MRLTGSLCTTTCHGTSSSSSSRVSVSRTGASTVDVDPFSSCTALTALIKKGYHTASSLQTTHFSKNFPLRDLHCSRARGIAIVEAMQMQQTVDNVQAQLARESISESPGVAASALDTNKNFAVLKRNHVGWSEFIHE